jgi:hypothetical protein
MKLRVGTLNVHSWSGLTSSGLESQVQMSILSQMPRGRDILRVGMKSRVLKALKEHRLDVVQVIWALLTIFRLHCKR